MSDTIGWAILGTGKIARAFANALHDTPGASLVACASRSQDSAAAFGRDFAIAACYGSYEELAGADGVDIVYIATPHALHHDNALLMLAGGKAVLCEKPFTMNLRQARAVAELARSKGLFLMEAMWTRFLPAIDEVRRLIDAGVLGKVSQVSADFGFTATTAPEHRLNNLALGGGALLDLGIYPLSIAAYLLGAVESVQAVARLSPAGVDEQTAFTLRHAGGGLSTCACSIRARTPIELTVSGELGYLRMESPFHKAQSLTLVTSEGSRQLATPLLGNGYVHEAIEAGRCLPAGLQESPRMPVGETLALMEVLDTMRAQIGLRYPADD